MTEEQAKVIANLTRMLDQHALVVASLDRLTGVVLNLQNYVIRLEKQIKVLEER